MKRSLAMLCLCACAAPQGAARSETPPSENAPVPPAPPTLPTRPLQTPPPLSTVVLRDDKNPIVSIRVVFHAGSADDPAGKEGLTSLTARLMKEGGTQALSSSELIAALFPMAAELEVQVDKELTVFSGRVHKDHLEPFLRIFTDVLLHPRWDARELIRLRADAVNATQNYLRGEDDELLGKVALEALLFQGHPYAHWANGTAAGLSALTLEDARTCAARVFTQERAVVGLAGPVDEALQRRVKDLLKALPEKGAGPVALPAPPAVQQQAWVLHKDNASTAISLGYAYHLRRDDPDFYKVAFGLSYLGEHRQIVGQLFDELREKRGLNYGDYAYPEHFVQDGDSSYPLPNVAWSQQMFSLWLRPVEPQNAVFAARGAVHYLDQVLQKGIPAERFEMMRGFLTGYTRLLEQTDQRRLGYAIDSLFYGTPDFLEGYRRAMASLTPEEVVAALRRHISVDRLNLVFIAKDAANIARVLREQPPTPIQYPTPKGANVLAEDKEIITQHLPVQPQEVEVREAATFMER